MKHLKKILLIFSFILILGFAAFTRLYGNNWDQGQHLNPDERFLTMVATSMVWPSSIREYLDTEHSKLNPHNIGYDFFVYGTWPVIFVKFVAEHFDKGDYGNLTLIGRGISGSCDLLTLLLVFLIGKRLAGKRHGIAAGLLSTTAYALMTLPIQLSHFYTTDPYLTLFLTLSIYLLLFPPSKRIAILLGLSTGLALSAKISGFLIFPVIGLYGLLFLITERSEGINDTYNVVMRVGHKMWKSIVPKSVHLLLFYFIFIAFFYVSFRLLMPYLFSSSGIVSVSLNQKVLTNWKTLEGFNNKDAWFPPGVQWINQPKILYPFMNIAFAGIGPPLFLLGCISICWVITKLKHHPFLFIPLLLFIETFIYQGTRYGMNMRYFWSMYPLLAVFIGIFLSDLYSRRSTFYFRLSTLDPIPSVICLLSSVYFAACLIYPISYLSIYSKPHSRITASEWIYTHIPQQSRLGMEHWDDPLPLNLPDYPLSNVYTGVELPMYGEDTPKKMERITGEITSD